MAASGKKAKPHKRKRSTRRRRTLIVKVKMSDEQVDLDAFAESYARALIREVQEERRPK